MRDRPQIPDYYSVLGIGFDASQDELRQAWRAAQKQWHPDRNPSPEAAARIREINAAWEVLGDPERRAEYDSVYFSIRARIAEEQRRAREAERLERERRERLRQQELERKMRAEAEARRREQEAEERRKAEERRRKQQEQRERQRRERAMAAKRAEAVAEARRRAEEEDKRDRERRRREEKQGEKAREQEERDEAGESMPDGGYRPPRQPSGATARGGGGRAWGLAVLAIIAIVAIGTIAVIAAFMMLGNWGATEDEPVVVVVPTVTRVPTPTPIPPTATAVPTATPVPPTPTSVPTPTVTPTPTPRLVIIYVTATPTPTVRALPTVRPRPTPRPTATPTPTPVPTRRPTATPTPLPTQLPTPSPTPKPRYQGSPLDLHDLLDRDYVTLDQVRALLELGAPVSAANIAGESPLTVAARRGHHTNILSLLIAHGADPSRNRFVLHALLRNPDVGSSQVLTLLQHGAHIDSVDINGFSPLEVAVANEQSVRVLRVLLFNGARLYTAPTILHDLLGTGAATAEKVKLLIDAGASATATDISGRTPLDVALENGFGLTILSLLGYDDSSGESSILLATPTVTTGPEAGQSSNTTPPCIPRSDVPCYPDEAPTATPTPVPPRELTLRSASGVVASRHGEGYIGCPSFTRDSEFISSAARMGVIEFDFVVPRVARWSVGVLYHAESNAGTDTATMTFRDGQGPLKVGYWTRANGVDVNQPDPLRVASDIVEALPGDIVKFEFATDDDGTTLTLDGVQVLSIPAQALRPLAGSMQMCVGFWSSESVDYGIEYKRLRAWSE